MMTVNPHVNSFDIFDTLVARRVINPEDIFSIIEEKFPFPNFKHYRTIAQKYSNHTIDDIYIKFKEIYMIDDSLAELLKKFEIETEINNCYLISTNYNRIKDGDILISDMYLKREDIIKILHSIGFTKQVTIFVSPNGKKSGSIWNIVKDKYSINLHLGDNQHSDIYMAKKAGIVAELTTVHLFNEVELFFIKNKLKTFAISLREFRHKNPYKIHSKDYYLYNDQAIYNIPLLILLSTTLYNIMMDEKRTTLLLLTRDGCLLKHIIKLMYPDIICKDLESSRYINTHPNEEYKMYLKSIYFHDTCLIFDLFGSFNTGRELYKELFGTYPRVHLLGYIPSNKLYDGLTYSSNISAEFFNVDTVGSLITMENGKFIRCPIIEYEKDNAITYKETVLSFCNFINTNLLPRTPLLKLFLSTISNFQAKTRHVRTHLTFSMLNKSQKKVFNINRMHNSLTDIADKLGVHKGSVAQCGHRYTDYYTYLFDKFVDYPIKILEIGLYLYGTHRIPSIELWKAYYGKTVTVYGYDHIPEFKKFHNPEDNIEIFIGTQDNKEQVEQCLSVNYDIVIDDGPHDSKGQQTMFKYVFPLLKSGGLYCIESLHWQPKSDYGMKTVNLFTNWKNGNVCGNEFLSNEESNYIFSMIESIDFYPSKSPKWDKELVKQALCIITRK